MVSTAHARGFSELPALLDLVPPPASARHSICCSSNAIVGTKINTRVPSRARTRLTDSVIITFLPVPVGSTTYAALSVSEQHKSIASIW